MRRNRRTLALVILAVASGVMGMLLPRADARRSVLEYRLLEVRSEGALTYVCEEEGAEVPASAEVRRIVVTRRASPMSSVAYELLITATMWRMEFSDEESVPDRAERGSALPTFGELRLRGSPCVQEVAAQLGGIALVFEWRGIARLALKVGCVVLLAMTGARAIGSARGKRGDKGGARRKAPGFLR